MSWRRAISSICSRLDGEDIRPHRSAPPVGKRADGIYPSDPRTTSWEEQDSQLLADRAGHELFEHRLHQAEGSAAGAGNYRRPRNPGFRTGGPFSGGAGLRGRAPSGGETGEMVKLMTGSELLSPGK
jgi:hypothetical protein